MSENTVTQPKKATSALHTTEASMHQRWRLLKDRIARYGIVVGGWGVIVAIVLIFFYLLYVVIPLFIPASAESQAAYPVPAQDQGKTLLLAMEEQNEIAVRFTDQAKAIFFNAKNGRPILSQVLKMPSAILANAAIATTTGSTTPPVPTVSTPAPTISAFAPQSNGEGIVVYGLSDGRCVVVKHAYRVSYPNNVRVISPVISYSLGEGAIVLDPEGSALQTLAFQMDDKQSTLVAKTASNKLKLVNITEDKPLFGEATQQRIEATLEGLDAE